MSLAQWQDITIPDRYNIFDLLDMGWAVVTQTIATSQSPDRWQQLMKHHFILLFLLLVGSVAFSQKDTIRGRQFQLTGKIIAKVELTPDCGIFAFGTVITFEVNELVGLSYPDNIIRIIITCPELEEENLLEIGNSYHVVFSDTNQASFEWVIPNRNLLKKNRLSFDPYAVSVKKKT
ncbi:MAG: hypothetical protein EOP48_31255 [Sphingobacteriales bacterium]|nr:MAG: hypothetical protein EOP48_31255 [Sphingobacteriales bacterium]